MLGYYILLNRYKNGGIMFIVKSIIFQILRDKLPLVNMKKKKLQFNFSELSKAEKTAVEEIIFLYGHASPTLFSCILQMYDTRINTLYFKTYHAHLENISIRGSIIEPEPNSIKYLVFNYRMTEEYVRQENLRNIFFEKNYYNIICDPHNN